MRLILTTLILAGGLCALFAVSCVMHEPKKSVTRNHENFRIYGWPHEWLAVSDQGKKEILLRRFAFSFGLVVVLPTIILVTLSVLLLKPGRKS